MLCFIRKCTNNLKADSQDKKVALYISKYYDYIRYLGLLSHNVGT